ncbi:aspartyl/glutamyl-tRNA(Asn/Gln) amidotransferase subunit B [Brockia lithotrophica]|uniref:Aspartyl/glutamyl-tRNA(Asn/Gln) amidotransferase subunit B n=2 Tax=Brockia lithotrophica TaxID=933949 RepID=A0A660KWA5_9BACL|nr:Asp-tRNA(Asn)/Glu-tRNA(Gln) amidotransferase subunit GatB [Brockia lithotrophica]RKQ84732.1 aspartyl/glutamyl-tRNA(Asn/Gln) amidotransferase subunit B [Brockia lithotrophica]
MSVVRGETHATEYEAVIGFEVHVELATATKLFCSCPTTFGAPPNAHTCPICLGHPGMLPLLNERAVEYALRATLAFGCEIERCVRFDRKQYFYHDLPKAYQISQIHAPIGRNGSLTIDVGGRSKVIRIREIHLEEDAGKSIHLLGDGDNATLIDFNRSGIPLIEIVTEPDISSPEEARAFLEELRLTILYLGISDVRMEEGSLRADANISVRPKGSPVFGAKVEVKNLNSISGVERAVAYEIERQISLLRRGERVVSETRRWDEDLRRTFSMRQKFGGFDYRPIHEPEVVPYVLEESYIERIRAELPELPKERRRKFQETYGLSAYDAGVLTANRELSDLFEAGVREGAPPKPLANWLMSEFLGYVNERGLAVRDVPITPRQWAELLALIENGTISTNIAKAVFQRMAESGRDPREIVEAEGLVQIADPKALREIVDRVLAANPKSVEDYRKGKEKALGFLVGQVMRETRGKAHPELVNQLLREALGEPGGA